MRTKLIVGAATLALITGLTTAQAKEEATFIEGTLPPRKDVKSSRNWPTAQNAV